MKGFILLLTAIILFVIIAPIAVAWQIIRNFMSINKYLFNIAIGVDQLGNIVCAQLFNDCLIKNGGYRFSNCDETISGVVGKNKQLGTLSFMGRRLYWLLDTIQKDHAEKAIEKYESNNDI